MKKFVFIFTALLFLVTFQLWSNPKYSKWQQPSYFRGYNVLYESPKSLQDFIDFKNYGGNLFHIQPDGFLNTDSPYGTVDANIEGTDMLVNFCREACIHYVIGMRSGPGAYDTYDESRGASPESRIWNTGNTFEQQKYAEMLKMVVERYGNDTLFVGINLVIEPRPKVNSIPANTSQLYKFFLENVYNIHMDRVYNLFSSKIREVDAHIPIIIENFGYSTPELFPAYEVNDPFIIYSAHYYQPNEFTKAEAPFTVSYPGVYWNITTLSQQLYNEQFMRETVLGNLRDFSEQTGSPVFIGEFGLFKPQMGGSDYVRDVLKISRDNGWHFALWDWRRGSGPEWNIEHFEDDNNETWKAVLAKFHAPPAPEQVSPVNGGNTSVNPVFKWDSLTAFTTYDILIKGFNGNDVQIFISDISEASYTYTGTQLEESITYTWKVRAKNPGGTEDNISGWSKPQTFYIPAPDNNNVSKDFSLNQNSPNPFNPSTNISFNIPKNSFVKLVIYDILGREVVKLVNEVKQEGSHSVIFNASNLPSGVYIYRLEALPSDGSNVYAEIKRMALIK